MKSRFILLAFFSTLFLVVTASVVFAQTPSVQTQFPFTINGQECNSKAECRVLCEDPVNQAACAKLNPNSIPKVDRFSDPTFAQAASAALGCSTAQTCKAVCSLKINFEKCHEFAAEHQLNGGYDKRVLALSSQSVQDEGQTLTDPDIELLQEAGVQLLNSGQTLESYCELEVNQQVCSVLAKRVGLRGGFTLNGPGGCQSAQTCRTYCDDPSHFAECRAFEISGLNGCTSELSCYNELQLNPQALKNVVFDSAIEDETNQSPSTKDPTQLAQTCTSVVGEYVGKTTKELASDLEGSGVCQVLPKTGVPGKNSNCDAYLSSDQPFDQTVFEKICEVSPVASVSELKEMNTRTISENINSYQQWCQELPSVGSSSTDWQVVPALCENFVTTFQQARTECAKPEGQRSDWLNDTVAYTRYCLSAPSDTSDYATSCAADPTSCQSGGFDWYCQQEGKSCVPLYQGRPLGQSVETFASAGLVKDGEKVSLILDESTQDFAQGALNNIVAQSGSAESFEVVSSIPQSISQTAVFVSGTGVDRVGGRRGQVNFQPTILRPKHVLSPTTQQPGNTFSQPWFLLNAYQQPQPTTSLIPSPVAGNLPAVGWNLVKQGEQDLRKKYLELQTATQNELRNTEGILLPPRNQIQVDPSVFRAQPIPVSPAVQPDGRVTQPLREPTRLPTGIQPTRLPTTSSPNTFRSPTPVTNPSTSGTNSTLPGTQPEPTRPPYIPPTQPPTQINPTQPPQTGSGSTTTTSGNGTTTTFDGSTFPSPPPSVQGVETQESFWGLFTELLKKLL